MILKGTTVKLYGNVQLGTNVILEDGVVIGHPSASELQGCLSELQQYESLEELYQSKSQNPTIIGDNTIIRSGTVIYSGVTIGNNFDCAHNVLIRENCTIGDFVYVKASTIIMKQARIGSQCRLSGMICDNSIIADHVSSFGILTHRYAKHYTPDMSSAPGPILHEGCIIGTGAILIEDVHIYEHAVVGANTLVNFNVPSGCLAVGPKGEIHERKGTAPPRETISQIGQMVPSRSEK